MYFLEIIFKFISLQKSLFSKNFLAAQNQTIYQIHIIQIMVPDDFLGKKSTFYQLSQSSSKSEVTLPGSFDELKRRLNLSLQNRVPMIT